MPKKGEMLPEEEEIILEFLEMFQEGGKRKIKKKREKRKKKKKIEWISPNLPPPPSHEPTIYDGRV